MVNSSFALHSLKSRRLKSKSLILVIYLRFIPTTRQTQKYPENFYTFLFRATNKQKNHLDIQLDIRDKSLT